MHSTFATLVVAGLAAQQVTATGWLFDAANKFNCPSQDPTQCSTEQQGGYDWAGLNDGAFSSYGSNSFSGFTCGNSPGKRDALSKRTFQSKCISGELHKEPSISCHDNDDMSIDTYQVSTSYDTDVEAHYGMPDGSTCKETHRCLASGNILKNRNCGGAKSVTFKPKRGESGKQNGESCSVGIHSIGFHCGSSSTATAPASSTTPSSTVSSTADVETTSAPAVYTTSSAEVASSVETSPVTTEASVSYSAPTYSNASSVAISSSSVESGTATSEASTATKPAYAPPVSISPSASTSSVISPIANSTVPAVSSSTVSSAVSSGSSAVATPNCPDLLPRCLNTWIWKTDCKDNSDSSCYCKNSDFVNSVMGCIESWSGADEETQKAASYLQGICAQYVPENPAIVTACPSTPATTSTASSSTEASPVESSSAPVYGGNSSMPAGTGSSTEASPVTTTSAQLTTSTVYSTSISTIASCADDVTDCPAESQSTAYVTKTIAISTTICPITASETGAVGATSSEASSEGSSQGIPAYAPHTSAAASSSESASEMSAPAYGASSSSIEVSPESTIAAMTTTSARKPAYAPPAYIPTTAATTPALTVESSAGPMTTITLSSSYQVPATYSTGESLGFTIPSSSTYATIDTTITVPQVQFTTSTITLPGSTQTMSVGLAAGSPSSAPAATTAGPVGAGAPPAYSTPTSFGTSYGTSVAPVPTASSSPIAPFSGDASIAKGSFAGLAAGAAAVLFVL